MFESTKGLPSFKFDEKTGNSTLLVASSKRGKSTIMKEIYDKYYKNDKEMIVILISPSAHIPLFSDIDCIKINKFNNSTQTLLRNLTKINQTTNNSYRFLIMVDDCIDVKFNKILNELILVLRNSNFSSIISIQYDKLLSKAARSSVNNICCGGINLDESIESLIKTFFKSQLVNSYKSTYDENPKMPDLIDAYRSITDDNDGHSFIRFIPELRDLEVFSLQL
jgi:hypothetical protein